MKRLLVLAYYFPPMGMSGVQRIVRLLRHLPAHGWQPTVVTASPVRYAAWDDTLAERVAEAGVEVVRTRSLDPLHLPARSGRVTHALPVDGARGGGVARALAALLVPDSKVGWIPFAVRAGVKLHRQRRFDAVLSTGPPHSAHVAAAWIAKATRLPLITDFRDDWLDAPRQAFATALHRRAHQALERWTLSRASEAWSVSAQTAADLSDRHPRLLVKTLAHGFDAEDYADHAPPPSRGRPMRLLYAGVFYGAQKPDTLLRAIDKACSIRPDIDLIAVFAGLLPSGFEREADMVYKRVRIERLGYLPASDAAAEMARADALWLTVGHQKRGGQIVPGKVSAYFGARRPILGLVPPGAARDALTAYGASRIADPDDVDGVAHYLISLYDDWKHERLPQPDPAFVARFDGRAVAARAAARLDGLVARPRADRDHRPARGTDR